MVTDRDLHARLVATSGLAAALVVPSLVDWFAPTSVVDLGCNVGVWLRAFMEVGIDDVLGFDVPGIDASLLRIPADRFTAFDLGQPLQVGRTFDLALCLEVAEHLPAASSERLVEQLVALAPAIVFSAGIPGQGGDGHINERWGSWWQERFAARGLERFDVFRRRLWDEPTVQWWYAQNLVVYARPDHPAAARLRSIEQPLPMDIVHPRLFAESMARPPTARQLLKAFPKAARESFRVHIADRLRSRG